MAGPGVAMFLAVLVTLLTACDSGGSDAGSRTPATGPDSADCSGGASATSNLQSAIRQLTDSLNALGPASQRNDVNGVLDQLDSARRAADQISGRLGAAATVMSTPSLIRTEFQNASDSSAGVRDTVDALRGAVTGNGPQGDQSAQLQSTVTAFNTSVERLTLACSNFFSASTVERTTAPPTRPSG